MVIWFTGLSGSGKTTLAKEILKVLPRGFLVDGDMLREGLCADLDFDPPSRHEQARRAAGVAKIAHANVCTVACSVITPLEKSREVAREMLKDCDFKMVYVSTPLKVCQQRDPKGLYAKVAAGEITKFTGISSPFWPPAQYDSVVDTTDRTITDCLDQILSDIGL